MNRVILDPMSKRFVDTGEKRHLSEEHKRKLGIAHIGIHQTEEAKRKNSLAHKGNKSHKGIPNSEETKRKISLALKGKPCSQETKEKLSIANKGEHHYMFGRHLPDGTKEKISLAKVGIPRSQETKNKISLAKVGIPRSQETRNKIRIATSEAMQRPEVIKAIQTKPNKSEISLQTILNKYFPNTYKYIGDLQVNIGGKFPDFINTNSKKEVIELFGSHWHSIEEAESTITHYKQYGFSCIVVWEEEIKDVKSLLEHIRSGSIYKPKYHRDYIKPKEVKKRTILDPITKKFTQVGSNVKNRN